MGGGRRSRVDRSERRMEKSRTVYPGPGFILTKTQSVLYYMLPATGETYKAFHNVYHII